MSEQQPDPTPVTSPPGEVAGKRLGVLLACFEGVSSASKARRPLSKQMSEGADEVLDEVILRVNRKVTSLFRRSCCLRSTSTARRTWAAPPRASGRWPRAT